ncbi:hypothetical protein EMPS_10095 [Entomortierella parvispora]|uniref:MSP domain-containing protein n=1 Tax=Entomortierella parvispora TaxID=205924 RepID=A0A9P3HJE9_9FUNG|nr:hypothetical protein EMPS_10095 [Entomortierella parvispora]
MALHSYTMPVDLFPARYISFRRPLTRIVEEPLVIVNPNRSPVAFKVKTTTINSYCVKPNVGQIPAGGRVEISVKRLAMSEEPLPGEGCRDKFLILTVPISSKWAGEDAKDLWPKIDSDSTLRDKILKQKLGVTFLLARQLMTPQTSEEGTAANDNEVDDVPPPYSERPQPQPLVQSVQQAPSQEQSAIMMTEQSTESTPPSSTSSATTTISDSGINSNINDEGTSNRRLSSISTPRAQIAVHSAPLPVIDSGSSTETRTILDRGISSNNSNNSNGNGSVSNRRPSSVCASTQTSAHSASLPVVDSSSSTETAADTDRSVSSNLTDNSTNNSRAASVISTGQAVFHSVTLPVVDFDSLTETTTVTDRGINSNASTSSTQAPAHDVPLSIVDPSATTETIVVTDRAICSSNANNDCAHNNNGRVSITHMSQDPARNVSLSVVDSDPSIVIPVSMEIGLEVLSKTIQEVESALGHIKQNLTAAPSATLVLESEELARGLDSAEQGVLGLRNTVDRIKQSFTAALPQGKVDSNPSAPRIKKNTKLAFPPAYVAGAMLVVVIATRFFF